MNEYKAKNLDQINSDFVSGTFTQLPETIEVYNITYTLHESTRRAHKIDIVDMYNKNRKAFVLYTAKADVTSAFNLDPNQTRKSEDWLTDKTTPKNILAFVWKLDGSNIVPHLVRFVDSDNLTQVIVTENKRPIIGNVLDITVDSLNGISLDAKVDTGADMSCIHAENIKSSGESVTFTINGNRYTMNQYGSVDIQTAGNGGESRPIVKLTITCNHCTIKDIEFDLNDRSDMPHKVLLGQDFLQAGNFLIDPLIDEQLFFDALNTLIEQDECISNDSDD